MFYDYVEVNPISNYQHLINRENLSLQDVRNAIKSIIVTAKKLKKIVVATNEPRYVHEGDAFIHKIYIQSKGLGGKVHNLYRYRETDPQYPILNFKTTKEMKDEFHFLIDEKLIDEIVVLNTNKIADSIEKITVIKQKLYTPKIEGSTEMLTELVYKQAKKTYGEELPQIVKERIEKELNVIIPKGYGVIY
jgi:DNA polymerase-3 subunit alpha (Gram-positive type)